MEGILNVRGINRFINSKGYRKDKEFLSVFEKDVIKLLESHITIAINKKVKTLTFSVKEVKKEQIKENEELKEVNNGSS